MILLVVDFQKALTEDEELFDRSAIAPTIGFIVVVGYG